MSIRWQAAIRYHNPNPLTTAELAELHARIPARATAWAERDTEAVWVELTIDADDAQAAATAALALGREAFGDRDVVDLHVRTEAAAEGEITTPRRLDLVNATDIGALLGVSRQRAQQLAARPDFPAPVGSPSSGPVWTRQSVQWWESRWDRSPGRRPSATGPAPE